MTQNIGFIILRHVNNKVTDGYWKLCYESIRKYYNYPIIIIDDNSNEFLDKEHEKTLKDTTVIYTAYPKRGEILPYFYYLSNKLFDIAVIIHDSVFINRHLDLNVEDYRFIWSFEHKWDDQKSELLLLSKLENSEELIIHYKNKALWKGCFGGMCIIKHDYLKLIDERYKISRLLPFIQTRNDRCYFERVIACILSNEKSRDSLLGDICKYCKWGIKIGEIGKYSHLPMIKVWTGR